MPKQTRRNGYGKKRMYKHRGGGWLDNMTQKATQLKNDAIQKSKDMGLHDKALEAHKQQWVMQVPQNKWSRLLRVKLWKREQRFILK